MMIRLYGGEVETTSWTSFRVMDRAAAKDHQRGFRSWLAWSLRRLADKTDGYSSVSVALDSKPALSESEKIRVMNCGLSHANTLFLELVEQEALDQAMRTVTPELYEGSQ